MPTVTFNSNKGTYVEPQTVNVGQLASEPQGVTKSNYVLLGWYSDASLSTKWSFNSDTVSEDTTLYAKWRLTIAAKLKQLFIGLKEDVDTKIPLAEKGQAEGVATLDSEGKIPVGQVNTDFNEVIKAATVNDFPPVGEDAKIYLSEDTKKAYWWDGVAYRVLSNQTFLQVTEPDYMVEGDIWFKNE